MAWDPASDVAATTGFEICDRVLDRIGARAEALVTAGRGRAALTRFANSRIHQNMVSDEVSVRLRVVVEGRVAQATTTRTDADGLERLVEGALAAAAHRPADPEYPGLAEPAPLAEVDHWDDGTAAADPDALAEVVGQFVAAAEGTEAAGYASTDADVHVMVTTTGIRHASRATRAQIDGIHRFPATSGPPTDGYAHTTSPRFADLDGGRSGAIAAQKARAGFDPIPLDPGAYEVVIEPKAVAELMLFPAWLGFNGKSVADGTSFVHLGEQQFDERITIWDDGTDDRALGRAYDAEGTPKRRVDLVNAGVTTGIVHDRRSARLAGTESTGSSIGSEAFGAFPGDLFLEGGDQTPEQLVAGVERGLLVTDFWYNRILDPKTQVITGLTRNGLFLIEAGEVTRPVQNLRFTQSIVAALGPGHVLGVGNDAQLVGNESVVVHVPSLRLASFAFTGGAKG